ncbi:MAG: hypothetical protein AAB654_01675 [Acidobacteriota bacterium]
MGFRRTVTIHACIVCLAGIVFTGWGPDLLPLYGFSAAAEFFPSAGSFVRLAGVCMIALGALLGAVRKVEEPRTQRSVARVLVESHLVAITVVTAQQIGIWVTPLGWVTVAVFLLITLAYVALLYLPRWRIRVPQ